MDHVDSLTDSMDNTCREACIIYADSRENSYDIYMYTFEVHILIPPPPQYSILCIIIITELMSSQGDPLSLETQCLRHLLCHLETFPPESLASLPVRLRRRLLANLPVADICLLEQTAVVDGVDMDELWCNDLLLERIDNLQLVDSWPLEAKEIYFEEVVRAIFGVSIDDRSIALPLVFAVGNPLGVDESHPSSLGAGLVVLDEQSYFVPQRYQRYFRGREAEDLAHDTVIQLKVVTESCRYRPPCIKLNMDGVAAFIQQTAVDSEQLKILSDCFCGVRELSLYTERDFGITRALQLILEAILSSAHPSLCYLHLDFSSVELGDSTVEAAPLFYSSNYIAFYFEEGSLHLPYTGLRHLIVKRRDGLFVANHLIKTGSEIVAIVRTHALEKFELIGLLREGEWDPCSDNTVKTYHQFLTDLSTLILQPQFSLLKFENIAIPFTCVVQLIETFLTTPTIHEQKLEFKSVYIVGKTSSVSPDSHLLADSNLEHKYLTLAFGGGGSNCSDLLTWISCCPHIRLNTLSIQAYEEAVTTVGQHSNLQIQNLVFVDCVPPSSSQTLGQALVQLLENPSLKSLEFQDCKISRNGNLPYLTEGLQRQARVGSLRRFSLFRDPIGEQPDDQIRQFFDAVFSFSGPELRLSLSYCRFLPKHLKLIHQSRQQFTSGKENIHLKLQDFHGVACSLSL